MRKSQQDCSAVRRGEFVIPSGDGDGGDQASLLRWVAHNLEVPSLLDAEKKFVD